MMGNEQATETMKTPFMITNKAVPISDFLKALKKFV